MIDIVRASSESDDPLERTHSAESFADQRPYLPDAGRGTELVAGRIVRRWPIEQREGAALFRLSEAVAEWLPKTVAQTGQPPGSFAFERGYVTRRNPDSVRVPPMSFRPGGSLFGDDDDFLIDSIPGWIVDFVTPEDDANTIRDRIATDLGTGVNEIWLIDAPAETVHCRSGNRSVSLKKLHDVLQSTLLPNFRLTLDDLFRVTE